jgi:hypothetical protein
VVQVPLALPQRDAVFGPDSAHHVLCMILTTSSYNVPKRLWTVSLCNVCFYDVGTDFFSYIYVNFRLLGWISHLILSFLTIVTRNRSIGHILSALFEILLLDCCSVLYALPYSTYTSFRIPYQCVHLWPPSTILTLYLANLVSFLISSARGDRLPQRWCRGLRSYGLLCWVARLFIPDVSKDRIAFIF